MAVDIAVAGSSLGGVIFPIMVSRLVVEVGFSWTIRICAFLILALPIVANLSIKSRILPHPRPVKLMDFITLLTEPAFALLTSVCVSCAPLLIKFANISPEHVPLFLGLFIPFTSSFSKPLKKGMGASLAGYLISTLNGASVFG